MMANTAQVPKPTSSSSPTTPTTTGSTGNRPNLSGSSSGVTTYGSSMWAQEQTTGQALADGYYQGSPLGERLQKFRADAASGGSPNIGSILDYRIDSPLLWGVDSAAGTTVAAYLARMRNADKATVYALQKKLAAAGFYDPAVYRGKVKPVSGVFDLTTQQAFANAVSARALAGDNAAREFDGFLGDQAAQVEANGGLGALAGAASGQQAFVGRPTASADIQNTYQNTSQSLTGEAHADYAAAAVAPEQAQEVSLDKQAYDMAGTGSAPGPGGVSPAGASPAAYAAEDLRQNHGAEVGAHAFLLAYNHLLQRVGLAG